MEAREVWEKKSEPSNFFEFVTAREHAGEDLRLGCLPVRCLHVCNGRFIVLLLG